MALELTAVIAGAATAVTLFACQHLMFLGLVGLFNRQIQPVFWLFSCSRPAIRAALHLSALIIAAVAIPLGFLIGSNAFLVLSAGLVAVISLGTEWTFMGNGGPLAVLLSAQEGQ